MPRSIRRTRCSGVMTTFSGLTSRWTMPSACTAPSASRTWSAISARSCSGTVPSSATSEARVCPSTRSITRKWTSSPPTVCVPSSCVRTTCGWRSRMPSSASRRNRASAPSSRASPGWNTFSATTVPAGPAGPSASLEARKTVPMPPCPSSAPTRYRPSRAPSSITTESYRWRVRPAGNAAPRGGRFAWRRGSRRPARGRGRDRGARRATRRRRDRRYARAIVRRVVALGLVAPFLVLGCGGGGGGGGGGIALTVGSVDFTVDDEAIRRTAEVVEITFLPEDCSVVEGSVISAGKRRLLRFDTVIENLGDQACVIGDPAHPQPPLPPDAFEFHECHGHWHLAGFAEYRLLHLDGTIAAIGHKQSFCITDSLPVINLPSAGYDCEYQGISAGWSDIYARGVPGQWIDVSGVPGGDYRILVTVNPKGILYEAHDVWPDTVTVPFHLPDPSAAVAQLDDHANAPDGATEMPVPAGFQP